MHPYIGIVCTYIQSDGLSTIAYDHNTLTRKSENTDNSPRDPLHGPVTWNPAWKQPYCMSTSMSMYTSTACASLTPSQSPQSLQHFVKSMPIIASGIQFQRHHWHPQFCNGSRFQLDLTKLFLDLIRLNWFLSIQFDSRLTYLFLIRVIQFESHSSQASGSPTLDKFSPKYSNT